MRTATCLSIAGLVSASIDFIALGDFGGSGSQHHCEKYTTVGQCSNAVTMNALADTFKAEFIIGPGDLIYSDGLDHSGSLKTDQHERMTNTFERVYSEHRCPNLQIPWYVVAGNHDHDGDVSLEIDWSSKTTNGKWVFPELYYKVSKYDEETGATMDFLMIDTQIIAGVNYYNTSIKSEPWDLKARDDQLIWLEHELKHSLADFVWVVGHYPIYSSCYHGATWGNMEPVNNLMKQYKATGMIAGHDHCLLDVQYDDMFYVLTGMGGRSIYEYRRPDDVPPGSEKFHLAGDNHGHAHAGFVTGSFTKSGGTIHYYSDVDPSTGRMTLEPLHTIHHIPPRNV